MADSFDGTVEQDSRPVAQRFHPTDALRKLHRASEPSLNQHHKVSNLPSSKDASVIFGAGNAPSASGSRSRHSSTESAHSQASDGFANSVRERHHDMGLSNLATHATIIESPSPSTFEKQDLGSYFFDPQSPNVSFNSTKSGGSSQHGPPTQPSALNPSRSRPFLKSHSAAIVPTAANLSQQERNGSSSSSSSFLGKRPNPYSKRNGAPSINAGATALAGRFATFGNAAERPTMPAPRRCQSSVDNAHTLSRFHAGGPLAGNTRQPSSGLSSYSLMPESSSTDSNLSVSMLDGDDAGSMGGGGPSPSPSMRHFPDGFDSSGSPVAPSVKSRHLRPGLMRRPSKDDSSPLPYGTRRPADRNEAGLALDYAGSAAATGVSPSLRRLGTVGESPESSAMQTSSPYSAECMPGFGASERAGKVLPCFNVKEDGLMRVTPQTLVELMRGEYNDRLESYQIVDCRFGYEYLGGHIPGAINLSTMEQVKSHFLSNGGPSGSGLPPRSQSGQCDSYGNVRKPILIFHCEFSAKRAPSMALALRQADRSLAHDYPNCHYPEVYILHGGYCGFYSVFSGLCEPNAYVQMDDPAYQDQRSAELNGFRKQFSRHRSFTYGDTHGVAAAPRGNLPYGRAGAGAGAGAERLSYDSKKMVGGAGGMMCDPRPSESRMASLAQGPLGRTKTGAAPPSATLMSEEESSFDDSSAADSPSARAALAMQSTLANKKKSNRLGATNTMLHAFPSARGGDIGMGSDAAAADDGVAAADADDCSSLDSSFDCSLNLGCDAAAMPTTLVSGPREAIGAAAAAAAAGAESPCASRKTSGGGAAAAAASTNNNSSSQPRRPFLRAGTTAGLFSTGR